MIWVVYDHPSDYPHHYVARMWDGITPTQSILVADEVEKIRAMLRDLGLVKLDRSPGDDPKIMETWL